MSFTLKLGLLCPFLAIACVSAFAGAPYQDAPAPLTPAQTELIQKAAFQEKLMVKIIQHHVPLVQTYIQHMRPDAKLESVPASDQYMLGRVDFGRTFTEDTIAKRAPKGMLAGSRRFISKVTDAFAENLSPNGFMDMMFIDTTGFDDQHYDFSYVREEFLGEVRAAVFDVRPKAHLGAGRFAGRIWIEDEDGNVIRFTGTFGGGSSRNLYFHFDSWRVNLQPFVWLPVAIYVQDQDFRGQTYFWGYSLKLPQASSGENESVEVENATDASDNSQDVSPMQAQQQWRGESERNVLDRLAQAGLLAAPSKFDEVLETVANNLVIGNKLDRLGPIHCRVMLTAPLESVSVGNTIILSKGLVDVLPSETALAAIISFQLAHIALGNQVDTQFAFNDRLLFPDEAVLERIAMNHSPAQNEEAAKKAIQLLQNSVYQSKLGAAGLFLNQLISMEKQLPALMTPRLGDALVRPDGTPWLAELTRSAEPLQVDNLQQMAALPLNSHLKIDAWTDEVLQLQVPAVSLLSASEKMPFEVAPIYYRLAKYRAPGKIPASGASAGAPGPSK